MNTQAFCARTTIFVVLLLALLTPAAVAMPRFPMPLPDPLPPPPDAPASAMQAPWVLTTEGVSMFAATQTCAPPPAGTHCVDLTWTASSGSGVTYNLYRTATTGACAAANRIASGITGTYFADMAVTNGATYRYAVSAQNSGGESACTSEVQVQILTPPGPPTNPNATPQ